MAKDQRGRKLPKGIRQRTKSNYEGRVMYRGECYYVHGKTITETQQRINDLRYKLQNGGFIERNKKLYDEWFHIWISEYKKNLKRGTVETYKIIYRTHLKDTFGNKYLSEIRGEHVQKLYNACQENDMPAGTFKVISAILGGSMDQAYKNGLIERNPVKLANNPRKLARKERIAMTKDQQKEFMDAATDSGLYLLFAVMLRTGMRSGEIRGLRYSDIDKQKGVIHVRRTLKESKGEFYTNAPKTAMSLRDIPLTGDLISLLDRQRAYYGFKVEKVDKFLFCNANGEPLRKGTIQNEIDRITKKINTDPNRKEPFPRITPHVFRHTFATRAIESGMQPNTLKTILGHSSLSMTMDLYTHVMPEIKAAEMDMIAAAF